MVISGSFQGNDQTYLVDALKQLGNGFVGVTQLAPDVSDEEVLSLHQHGVRGARFNLYRGGREQLLYMVSMAQRLHDLVGWHIELYVDSNHLKELSTAILQLPRVSIDHLGMSEGGLRDLLHLVEKGVHVKATGFGRVKLDVVNAMKRIHETNPSALMFGTDLPSTRAERPYSHKDYELVCEVFSEKDFGKVLFQNAMAFYRVQDH
ncbi:2-pyrone-4,6-dicarboxylate hydrolase [Hydrogenovibrio marinus]|nr:2-pyrone-4,6-dicarboxylate hydrolase [Hydrogenovibrio marinus]